MFDTAILAPAPFATPKTPSHFGAFSRAGRLLLCSLAICLLSMGGAAGGRAQTAAVFGGAYSQVDISLKNPMAVALDANGRVFIVDQGNQRLVMDTPNGQGGYTQSTIVRASNIPGGAGSMNLRDVAVDPSGNVYVVDLGNTRVLESSVNPDGSFNPSVDICNGYTCGLYVPTGIAFDKYSNLYIIDPGNDWIYVQYPGNHGKVNKAWYLDAGQWNASQIAVDQNLDIWVNDTESGYQQLIEFIYGGTSSDGGAKIGTYSGLFRIGNCCSSSGPQHLAVDAAMNLYAADPGWGNVVKWTSTGTGSWTPTATEFLRGLNGTWGVGLDTSGKLFIADSGSNRVIEASSAYLSDQAVANFGQVRMGATSGQTFVVTFIFTGGGQIGAPLSTSSDFETVSAGTTCSTSATYSAGQSCAVAVQFRPQYPGTRMGAIQLQDTSGDIVASAYVFGTGMAPLAAFSPAAANAQDLSVNHTPAIPEGVALDSAGNVYVADLAHNSVLLVSAASGTSVLVGSNVSVGGLTMNSPNGVALDAAGNLYIADTNNSRVLKRTPSGTMSRLNTGASTPVSKPIGLATDGAGNLYIADSGNQRVVKVTPSGVGSVVTLADSLLLPSGVAVDGAGDVYMADYSDNRVLEVTAAGVPSVVVDATTQIAGKTLSAPEGLALDANGDLYIGDSGNNRVVVVPPTGAANASVVNTGSFPLDQPSGVAVVGAGALYIADALNGRVVELTLGTGAPYRFASTVLGSTSADSPQEWTVTNIGNAALSFSAVSVAGTAEGAGSFTSENSSCGPSNIASLNPGSTCIAGADFTPQAAGSLSGAVTLGDNSLNNASAQQTISLSGTGTQGTPTISVSTPTAITYGTASVPLSATVGFAGKAPTGAVSFTVNGASIPAASCGSTSPMTCTASFTSSSLAPGGYPISASIAADANYLGASSSSVTLTVNQATPTVTVNPASTTYGAATTPLTASISYGGWVAPTGRVTFMVPGSNLATATCTGTASPLSCTVNYASQVLGGGSNSIFVSTSGDANYMATSGVGTLTVNKAALSVAVSPVTIAYGTASTTLTASIAYTGSAAPSGAVSFAVDSGAAVKATCTGKVSPLACSAAYTTSAVNAGSHTVTAKIAESGYYYAASGTALMTVGKATPKVTVTPVAITYGTATATLTAGIAYTGPAAPSGAVSFTVDSGTAVKATCTGTSTPRFCSASYATASLAAGSHTIKATIAADANYLLAANTSTLAVNKATPKASQ